MLSEPRGAQSATRVKPSDNIMSEVERLNNRLDSTLKQIDELRNRVRGTLPDGGADAAGVESAFNIGGFVGGVGQALERAHRTLTQIGSVIDDLDQVI